MFDVLKQLAAGIAGALLMAAPAYWSGVQNGKEMAAMGSLSATVSALRERGMTDAEIASLGAAGLCGAYGLSDDSARECVRRVEEASHAAGDGGVHHDE